MPLPSKTKRLTLESVGAPELFIEFRRTAGMMYGEFLDIFGEEELPRSDGSDGSDGDFGDFVDQIKDYNLTELINITVIDHGSPLEYRITDNENT